MSKIAFCLLTNFKRVAASGYQAAKALNFSTLELSDIQAVGDEGSASNEPSM